APPGRGVSPGRRRSLAALDGAQARAATDDLRAARRTLDVPRQPRRSGGSRPEPRGPRRARLQDRGRSLDPAAGGVRRVEEGLRGARRWVRRQREDEARLEPRGKGHARRDRPREASSDRARDRRERQALTCALQAVAGLGPRRPRRTARWTCALQAVAGLGPRRPRRTSRWTCALQAVAGLGPRRPRRTSDK